MLRRLNPFTNYVSHARPDTVKIQKPSDGTIKPRAAIQPHKSVNRRRDIDTGSHSQVNNIMKFILGIKKPCIFCRVVLVSREVGGESLN